MTLSSDLDRYLSHPLVGLDQVVIGADVLDSVHDIVAALPAHNSIAVLTDEDVYDSLGEVANIVGGNIKALVPDAGPLGLPVVSTAVPLHGASDRLAARLDANWQGQWLTFEVWLAGGGTENTEA